MRRRWASWLVCRRGRWSRPSRQRWYRRPRVGRPSWVGPRIALLRCSVWPFLAVPPATARTPGCGAPPRIGLAGQAALLAPPPPAAIAAVVVPPVVAALAVASAMPAVSSPPAPCAPPAASVVSSAPEPPVAVASCLPPAAPPFPLPPALFPPGRRGRRPCSCGRCGDPLPRALSPPALRRPRGTSAGDSCM